MQPGPEAQIDRAKIAEAAATCACFNFRKASRAVTSFFDAKLQPSGLRSTQLVILIAVALSEAAALAQLARLLVMERSTLTRNLRPLEKQGLLRVVSGSDRRTRLVELTPEGRSALAGALPLWEEAQGRFVHQLGTDRWNSLLSNLTATVDLTHNT
jgi:DNA-binding MarR family transcriptional regulator